MHFEDICEDPMSVPLSARRFVALVAVVIALPMLVVGVVAAPSRAVGVPEQLCRHAGYADAERVRLTSVGFTTRGSA
jgi:hypothetical protein